MGEETKRFLFQKNYLKPKNKTSKGKKGLKILEKYLVENQKNFHWTTKKRLLKWHRLKEKLKQEY